ncbi:MAG: hypothetical protein J2O39_08175, partial [Acidimicrobiales bacterium]|nr:hypothetical protein [Acidimicrobiales bacterium]
MLAPTLRPGEVAPGGWWPESGRPADNGGPPSASSNGRGRSRPAPEPDRSTGRHPRDLARLAVGAAVVAVG